jgi:hypothetical protein
LMLPNSEIRQNMRLNMEVASNKFNLTENEKKEYKVCS